MKSQEFSMPREALNSAGFALPYWRQGRSPARQRLCRGNGCQQIVAERKNAAEPVTCRGGIEGGLGGGRKA